MYVALANFGIGHDVVRNNLKVMSKASIAESTFNFELPIIT